MLAPARDGSLKEYWHKRSLLLRTYVRRLRQKKKHKVRFSTCNTMSFCDPTMNATLIGLRDREPTGNSLCMMRKASFYSCIMQGNGLWVCDKGVLQMLIFCKMPTKAWPIPRCYCKDLACLGFEWRGLQVLVFCTMTKALDVIEDYMEWRGWPCMRMDGSTPTEERGRMVEDFNSPSSSSFVFLLSTRTGGVGLNLQSADTAIMYDSDWNPQIDLQAQARIHRLGQTKQVRPMGMLPLVCLQTDLLGRIFLWDPNTIKGKFS